MIFKNEDVERRGSKWSESIAGIDFVLRLIAPIMKILEWI